MVAKDYRTLKVERPRTNGHGESSFLVMSTDGWMKRENKSAQDELI